MPPRTRRSNSRMDDASGRTLPEGIPRHSPEGIVLELCKNIDLAAEVSLQPLRIVGVDAVIFFSDILIPVEAMGVNVSLTDKGPEIENPVRSMADVRKLRVPDPASEVPFVGNILKRLRSELRNEVPLVGFSGAPWTLASYMIEGGGSKSFAEIKKMAYSDRRRFTLFWTSSQPQSLLT